MNLFQSLHARRTNRPTRPDSLQTAPKLFQLQHTCIIRFDLPRFRKQKKKSQQRTKNSCQTETSFLPSRFLESRLLSASAGLGSVGAAAAAGLAGAGVLDGGGLFAAAATGRGGKGKRKGERMSVVWIGRRGSGTKDARKNEERRGSRDGVAEREERAGPRSSTEPGKVTKIPDPESHSPFPGLAPSTSTLPPPSPPLPSLLHYQILTPCHQQCIHTRRPCSCTRSPRRRSVGPREGTWSRICTRRRWRSICRRNRSCRAFSLWFVVGVGRVGVTGRRRRRGEAKEGSQAAEQGNGVSVSLSLCLFQSRCGARQ